MIKYIGFIMYTMVSMFIQETVQNISKTDKFPYLLNIPITLHYLNYAKLLATRHIVYPITIIYYSTNY